MNENKNNSVDLCLALTACVVISAYVPSAIAGQEEPKYDSSPTSQPQGAGGRETVLDRVVHIETNIQEVPNVPPLCDAFKGEKRRINVGDCELYCETEGKGLPIVLINGGPGGTHHGFHPYFSRAAEFATVVYYDQRGCGQSDYKKGSGYTVDQAVDDLDKLREALKIDRWIVLGWSYGGFLAQCYIAKYPERVAGLVLVSAQEAMPLKLNGTRQYDYLSREEQKRISEIQRNRTLALDKLVYNTHLNGDWKRQGFYRPTEEQLARMARYEWKHDPEFRNSIGRQIGNVDLTGAFEQCPIPVLIMEGKWDLTWNTDKPEKMQKSFPGSKLVMFERASHGTFQDEPEIFFQVLKGFAQNLPKVSASDITRWKKAQTEKKKKQEAEKKMVSQEITFRTAEKAPRAFDSWTIFWQQPKVSDDDALVGYQVQKADGKVYFDWGPNKMAAGESSRSDFAKDPAVFYDKDIFFTLRVTKGTMNFPQKPQFHFEFYKKGNRDKPIKTIPAIMDQKVEGTAGAGKKQVATTDSQKVPGNDSPDQIIQSAGWGRKGSKDIASKYADTWLKQLNPGSLLRLGFALYDEKRYDDALQAFQKMEKKSGGDPIALIWQGQMLDLLGKRDEAIAKYQKVADMNTGIGMRHDQYGIVIGGILLKERIQKPFTRVENKEE